MHVFNIKAVVTIIHKYDTTTIWLRHDYDTTISLRLCYECRTSVVRHSWDKMAANINVKLLTH